jgi:hypothetical protein
MDPQLRGLIEQTIDEGLKPERLLILREAAEFFDPVIKSKRDMMFGHLTGYISGALPLLTSLVHGRQPTDPEKMEMRDILRRRAQEIIDSVERELAR